MSKENEAFEKDAMLHKLQEERDRYKKAYHILMEHWYHIPDEDKKDIDKRLDEINL